MKKLTTKIMDNGKEKEIAVFLDDETARVLEECGDKELKHGYIVEEYKYQLIERRETRRHQSLEKSIESGHEFVDHKADVEQNLEKKEEIEQLYKALKFLTKNKCTFCGFMFWNRKHFRKYLKSWASICTRYTSITSPRKKS